jgi:CheY-like chemotaxis protein
LDFAGVRAFVVEDEALVLLTLEDMLVELGCRTAASAQHVDEALRLAVDVAADVALLDVNVGGTRIDPVAQVLAARRIPIVFVTGYEAPNLPDGLGRVTRVAKPFQKSDLVAALRRVLATEGAGP